MVFIITPTPFLVSDLSDVSFRVVASVARPVWWLAGTSRQVGASDRWRSEHRLGPPASENESESESNQARSESESSGERV
jgi:hypothetical protein